MIPTDKSFGVGLIGRSVPVLCGFCDVEVQIYRGFTRRPPVATCSFTRQREKKANGISRV